MEISKKNILKRYNRSEGLEREEGARCVPRGRKQKANSVHSKPIVNILWSPFFFFFLMYSLACVFRIGILLLSHLLHNINISPFHNECF